MRNSIDVRGVFDIHGHCGPSLFDRRVDGYEFAREAAEAGMAAVVMKEHFLPTVYGIPFIDRLLKRDDLEIGAFGGAVMNYCNGGFNPFMVETAIGYGAAFLWAPTIDARNQVEVTGKPGKHTHHKHSTHTKEEYRNVSGLYALTESGNLKDEVKLCIRKIVDNNVGLGIGHLSYEETEAMIEYAADLGHDRLLIDHPGYPTEFSLEQRESLISMGAQLNFTFTSISAAYHRRSAEELYRAIRDVGVDNCVISSGTGQIPNVSSPEAMRLLGEILLENGLSVSEFDVLARKNPAQLVDLD